MPTQNCEKEDPKDVNFHAHTSVLLQLKTENQEACKPSGLCRSTTPGHHKRFIGNQRKQTVPREARLPHAVSPVAVY